MLKIKWVYLCPMPSSIANKPKDCENLSCQTGSVHSEFIHENSTKHRISLSFWIPKALLSYMLSLRGKVCL